MPKKKKVNRTIIYDLWLKLIAISSSFNMIVASPHNIYYKTSHVSYKYIHMCTTLHLRTPHASLGADTAAQRSWKSACRVQRVQCAGEGESKRVQEPRGPSSHPEASVHLLWESSAGVESARWGVRQRTRASHHLTGPSDDSSSRI